MRKELIALVLSCLLTSAHLCNAQHYQCLQAGVQRYFTNAYGYLRGIRIDRTDTNGDTIIYHPFHTPRGPYGAWGAQVRSLDILGGSWLGKNVKQAPDGTFIFDNYWTDSTPVIIKTQAVQGDRWVMYKETSNLYYTATVTRMDTMHILSAPDSVKYITINAWIIKGRGDTEIVSADSLNGSRLILSRNNGFVSVCDLYTFPYHKPGQVYRQGQDFTLDQVIITGLDEVPNTSNSLFNLIDFINPTEQQLYNWNVGDTFQCEHLFSYTPLAGPPVYTHDYITEGVSTKEVSGHIATITLSGENYACSNANDPCAVLYNARTYTFSDGVYPVLDPLLMPEESTSSYIPNVIYYYPNDNEACLQNPMYAVIKLGFVLDSASSETGYKTGLGRVYYLADLDSVTEEKDGLVYARINGSSCGMPSSIKPVVPSTSALNLYPNPARTMISIESSAASIADVTIMDLVGHTVYHQLLPARCHLQTIDVTSWPAGMYLVRVNGSEVRKFVKE